MPVTVCASLQKIEDVTQGKENSRLSESFFRLLPCPIVLHCSEKIVALARQRGRDHAAMKIALPASDGCVEQTFAAQGKDMIGHFRVACVDAAAFSACSNICRVRSKFLIVIVKTSCPS